MLSPSGSGRTRWLGFSSDTAGAILVGLLALVVYGLTVQRTLSFWDCGEFIACSAILGIAHPPGSPLYVLFGRLFAALPVPADIGLRVNLVSVLFGALSVSLVYVIVARLTRRILLPQPFEGREGVIFVCGACGALTAGFGSTVWANAIEAEVYGLTLFLFMSILLLALLWFERRDTQAAPRLLVLATFLAGLGQSVHMMVYLALPALWLTVFAANAELRKDARVWAAAFATLTIMGTGVEAHLACLVLVLCMGLWNLSLLSGRNGRSPLSIVPVMAMWGLLLTWRVWPDVLGSALSTSGPARWSVSDWTALGVLSAALLLAPWLGGERTSRAVWRLPVALSGASLVAFSLLLFVPVRSAQDPAIDENDPETWTGLQGFLERKQYGRESMIERMFTRRGEWSHQLGRHPRMGFWSFFEIQYGLKSESPAPERGTVSRFAFLVLVALGALGALSLAWLEPREGVPLLLVLLLCTVGLVVYMNFADGTRYNPNRADQAYLEVRDRDYFFTTGFALFGVCLGLGVAAFMRAFRGSQGRLHRALLWTASAVFLFSLPWKTVEANWWTHDRSRNFVPYDYAHNMLESCEPDALLFTNGDNDTFPLWCLQEAYGVRKDVQIINLSLANTLWYVRQAKSRGVPFDPAYEEIDRLRYDPRLGRIQDQVLATVVESNRWERPVYFGSSTPEGSRVYRGQPLDSHLVMEGLVMRLSKDAAYRGVDAELVLRRHLDEYRLRGLNDSTLYLDPATSRIADNYATSLLFVADHYRRLGQVDSARAASVQASRLRPELTAARNYLVQLSGEFDRRDTLDSLCAGRTAAEQADLHFHFALAAEHVTDTLRAIQT